ncbi:MAG: PspA/IM30 family protein, partial [Pseudomonadota bacterium]
RALRREQEAQVRLRGTVRTGPAIDEAEALIARVLQRDDPAEQVDILREIESGLGHEDLPDRMAAEGFGDATRITPADILARLKTKS